MREGQQPCPARDTGHRQRCGAQTPQSPTVLGQNSSVSMTDERMDTVLSQIAGTWTTNNQREILPARARGAPSLQCRRVLDVPAYYCASHVQIMSGSTGLS